MKSRMKSKICKLVVNYDYRVGVDRNLGDPNVCDIELKLDNEENL